MHRAQSAIEYLMTYGWAVLIIAVILGILFQLGIFGGSIGGDSSCTSNSGFYCQQINMNSSGYISATIGQSISPLTVTGVGCSKNLSQPTSWTGTTSLLPLTLAAGQQASVDVQCLSTKNEKIGSTLSGSLWLSYTVAGSSQTLYAMVGRFTTAVGTSAALGPSVCSSGTNSISVTSSLSLATITQNTLVSYTMYGGGGQAAGSTASESTGSFNIYTTNTMSITVGGGGGGGSGYYGGGGGGRN